MSDRLLKESDVLRAIDRRIKELSVDPAFIRKHGFIDIVGVKKHILAIPSADRPQGEWIPCSERLPKENTEVLMSLEWGIDIGEYRNGDWHSEWINHYDDGNVLAWMPLPQPYKGADDE